MFTAIGAIGIVTGMVALIGAANFPARRAQLEAWGGGLFVGSIALLALNFPMI